MRIVVETQWVHPHFGGDKCKRREFSVPDAIEAVSYYIDENDDKDPYSHTTIKFVEEEV